MTKITLNKIKELWGAIEDSKDIPTHVMYYDEIDKVTKTVTSKEYENYIRNLKRAKKGDN